MYKPSSAARRALFQGLAAGLAVLALLIVADRGIPSVPNPLQLVVSTLVSLAPAEPAPSDYDVPMSPVSGASPECLRSGEAIELPLSGQQVVVGQEC